MDVEAGDGRLSTVHEDLDREVSNGGGGDVGAGGRERRGSVGSVGRTESAASPGESPTVHDDIVEITPAELDEAELEQRDEEARMDAISRVSNRYKTLYAVHLISLDGNGVLQSEDKGLQNVSQLHDVIKAIGKESQRSANFKQKNQRVIDINRYTIHVRYKLVSHHLDTIMNRVNGLQPNWDMQEEVRKAVRDKEIRASLMGPRGLLSAINISRHQRDDTTETTTEAPSRSPPKSPVPLLVEAAVPMVSYRIVGRFSSGGECNLILESAIDNNLGREMCRVAYNEVKTFLDSFASESAPAAPKEYESEVDLPDLFTLVDDMESRPRDPDHCYYMHPYIEVKKHAVLVALEGLRAVLMANKLFLIFPEQQPEEEDATDRKVVERVKELMVVKAEREAQSERDPSLPPTPEHTYFDATSLFAVMFEVRYKQMRPTVTRLKAETEATNVQYRLMKYRVSSDDLEACLKLRNRVDNHLAEFSAHKQCLDEALHNSDGMTMMNVSFLADHPEMYHGGNVARDVLHAFDKGSIECELYEAMMHCRVMERRLLAIQSEVADIIQHVDSAKNDEQTVVLVVNTAVTILSACISFGGVITGAFGMNLDQTVCPGETCLQTTAGTFQGVCIATLIFITAGAPLFVLLLQFFGFLPSAFIKKGGAWCAPSWYLAAPMQSTKNPNVADADSKPLGDNDDGPPSELTGRTRRTTTYTTMASRPRGDAEARFIRRESSSNSESATVRRPMT